MFKNYLHFVSTENMIVSPLKHPNKILHFVLHNNLKYPCLIVTLRLKALYYAQSATMADLLRDVLRALKSPFDIAPAQCAPLPPFPPYFVGSRHLGHSACPGTLSTCNYIHTVCSAHPNEPAGDTATLHYKQIDCWHILK